MEIHEIIPYVRYISELSYSEDSMYRSGQTFQAYDSRFIYCLSGSGEIELGGERFPMKSGSLLIWKSAIPYRYIHSGNMGMICIRANFDFTYENASVKKTPIPPDVAAKFIPEHVIDKTDCLDHLYLANALSLENLILLMKKTFDGSGKYKAHECSALMKLIIARATALYENESNEAGPVSIELAEKVCQYITEHIGTISSGKQLGDIFSYHPYYLNRIITKYSGITLHEYLRNARIQKAMKLLNTTDLPIAKIAEECGFCDSSHFSKQFKAVTGYRPSKYRYL